MTNVAHWIFNGRGFISDILHGPTLLPGTLSRRGDVLSIGVTGPFRPDHVFCFACEKDTWVVLYDPHRRFMNVGWWQFKPDKGFILNEDREEDRAWVPPSVDDLQFVLSYLVAILTDGRRPPLEFSLRIQEAFTVGLLRNEAAYTAWVAEIGDNLCEFVAEPNLKVMRAIIGSEDSMGVHGLSLSKLPASWSQEMFLDEFVRLPAHVRVQFGLTDREVELLHSAAKSMGVANSAAKAATNLLHTSTRNAKRSIDVLRSPDSARKAKRYKAGALRLAEQVASATGRATRTAVRSLWGVGNSAATLALEFSNEELPSE